MFKNAKAFSGFSVPNIERAKQFYSETLGLNVIENPEGLELKLEGGASVFVYSSPSNKPADFTILNFVVDDIEKAVDNLTAKGVHLEQLNMPEFDIKTDAKGIARNSGGRGPRAIAWFKDPAGNTLAVMQL